MRERSSGKSKKWGNKLVMERAGFFIKINQRLRGCLTLWAIWHCTDDRAPVELYWTCNYSDHLIRIQLACLNSSEAGWFPPQEKTRFQCLWCFPGKVWLKIVSNHFSHQIRAHFHIRLDELLCYICCSFSETKRECNQAQLVDSVG